MKKIIFLLMILPLVFTGCKKKKASSDDTATKKYINTIAEKAIKNDTLRPSEDFSKEVEIDSPSVVFFMPEYKERQNIMHFYGDDPYSKMQLQQMFRNFFRLYRAVRPELKKDSINCFFTYHWKFKIKTDTGYIYFDRKEQNQIFGFILADGHSQPQIFYGLYRIGEMESLISNYFKIKDFKVKQYFSIDQSPPIEGSP